MKIFKKDQLKILQWNSDVLSTKVDELRTRAAELDLDVILIQETKLSGRNTTPRIHGYKEAIRTYGTIAKGGGILCYV